MEPKARSITCTYSIGCFLLRRYHWRRPLTWVWLSGPIKFQIGEVGDWGQLRLALASREGRGQAEAQAGTPRRRVRPRLGAWVWLRSSPRAQSSQPSLRLDLRLPCQGRERGQGVGIRSERDRTRRELTGPGGERGGKKTGREREREGDGERAPAPAAPHKLRGLDAPVRNPIKEPTAPCSLLPAQHPGSLCCPRPPSDRVPRGSRDPRSQPHGPPQRSGHLGRGGSRRGASAAAAPAPETSLGRPGPCGAARPGGRRVKRVRLPTSPTLPPHKVPQTGAGAGMSDPDSSRACTLRPGALVNSCGRSLQIPERPG